VAKGNVSSLSALQIIEEWSDLNTKILLEISRVIPIA